MYIVDGIVKENRKKGTTRHPKGLDIHAHCTADGRGLVNIDKLLPLSLHVIHISFRQQPAQLLWALFIAHLL